MNEIYWITRIAQLNNILVVITILFGVCTILCSLIYIIIISTCTTDEEKENAKKSISYTKKFAFAFIFSGAILVFIPSKKDLVLIYGLGPTIDYIQNSDKAKQIPDKAVEALLEYLENDKDNKDK